MAWAPDYITSAELKAFMRIGDDQDDNQIAVAITAASRAIDNHCNRQFGKVAVAEERFYTASYLRGRWFVDMDDLMDATGFAVDVDGVAVASGWVMEPRNAASLGRPWTRLRMPTDAGVVPVGSDDEIALTGLWGWSAVPVAVKQAAFFQASRFLNRRDSPFGIAGSPQQGSELRLLARVDPDLQVALQPYVRPRSVF